MVRSKLIVLALLMMFSHRLTHAQSLVPPDEISAVEKQISSHPRKDTLECDEIYLTRFSNLGFDLRYHAGFYLRLSLGQMPAGGKVEARIRVTPKNGPSALLSEYFDIPSVSQALRMLPQSPGPIVASMSGDFVTGPGKYEVELLLISPDNRMFFKRWGYKTDSTGFEGIMKPNTVGEALPNRWDGKLDPNGIRLTLLLNATAESPFQAQLRDYHFLLTMVKTILERFPCRSLRIVAFNLDQQGELFRRDGFTLEAWDDLEAALKGARLSTIDYNTLRSLSKSEFLTLLLENEVSAPSDVVVVVGRRTHFLGKPQPRSKTPLRAGNTRLYYLRYDGHEYKIWRGSDEGIGLMIDQTNRNPEMPVSEDLAFEINQYRQKPIPDNLTYLMQDLHGTVLPFNSSSEFGKSIELLRAELASPCSAP